jgi:hypothetical protein
MTTYNPPHEVRDQQKLADMIAMLDRGESLPPVLVCGSTAYSGSHRLAAWLQCGVEPIVVEITEDQHNIIMERAGFIEGYITDYEDYLNWAGTLFDLGDVA